MQQTTPAIPVQSSTMSLPDGSGAFTLYVANWYRNAVEVISGNKKHALLREISTAPYAPNSVHVDGDGNLWVALNTAGNDPSLYVYKPGTFDAVPNAHRRFPHPSRRCNRHRRHGICNR